MKSRWQLIQHHVKSRSPVVIQVGANDGAEVPAFKSLWPLATIYCFEPRNEARQAFMAKVWQPGVQLIDAAVAETQGMANLHINRRGGTSSLLEINMGSPYYQAEFATERVLRVPTMSLDDFCGVRAIREIGLLMIDVQGAELGVLRGAKRLLHAQAIDVIYTEVFFVDLYHNCPLSAQIGAYLTHYGYEFMTFYNVERIGGKPVWGDAVFVKGD